YLKQTNKKYSKHGRVCGSRCLGPMTFHPEVKGQLVSICQGAHLAMRDISCFKHGLVFLSRPVKIKERISICIESTVPSWDGALRVGFTNHCPNANLIPPMAIPDLRETPGYCAVPVPEETCQTGAHVEFWMNHAGYVMIQGADGKTFYMKVKGQVKLNEPLYVFLDMYGSTSAVRLLGNSCLLILTLFFLYSEHFLFVFCSRKGTRTSCPDSPKDLEQFSSSETKVKEQGQMKSFFNFNKNVHSGENDTSGTDGTLVLMTTLILYLCLASNGERNKVNLIHNCDKVDCFVYL
uniref:NHR domain-containing protein n=1 Tax=Astyanax mexicanus TaxID=7994 RepID=A0A8B9KZD1_ASTMX